MTTTADRPTILGDEVPHQWATVPIDVYAQVLDAETRQPTGFIRRLRWRTPTEIFRDLYAAVDLWTCPKCDHDEPLSKGKREQVTYHRTCRKCGVEMEHVIDEYFCNSADTCGYGNKPRGPLRQVIAYTETGGNEGTHVMIGALVEQGLGKPCAYIHWFHWKTLREGDEGLDRAFAFARRVTKLMGL